MTKNAKKSTTGYVVIGLVIVSSLLALSALIRQEQKDVLGSEANWKKFFQDVKQKRDQGTVLPAQKSSPSPESLSPTTPLFCGKTSVFCSQLAASFTSGSAACRPNTAGYDVSTCSITVGKAEMVKPAVRKPDRWQNARCNDGSPFGFDVRLSPTRSREWVIFLEGGAFCDDRAKSCSQRQGQHSYTPPEADRAFTQIKPQGIFNPNKSANPTFYAANVAYARYCSSDGWSGATADRRPSSGDPAGWYFSGRLNVRAMIEILKERYGLDDAHAQTKILFAGSSSGGAGVEANADNVAALLPQTSSRGNLKLVNDGGFIPDFDDPKYRPGSFNGPIRDLIALDYSFWRSKLNPECEKANSANSGRCFLGNIIYPYISGIKPNGLNLPFFEQYSSIDKFAIDLHGIDNPKDPNDQAALGRWRRNTLTLLGNVAWVFSGGAKPYHTLLSNDSPTNGWKMGPPGKTFQEMLTRFWLNAKPERVIFGNPAPNDTTVQK